MRRYVFTLATLAIAALGPTLALGDDQQIAQQIIQKLQQEKQSGSLKGFSIDLQVEEGTVWMSGRVATIDQQAKALDIARRVMGVKQVVNDLSIAGAGDKVATSSSTKSMLQSMGSAMKSAWNRGEEHAQPKKVGVEARTASLTKESESRMSTATSQAIGTGVDQSQQLNSTRPIYTTAPAGIAQPVYAGSNNAVPLAFAPARQVGHGEYVGNVSGGPVPMHLPGSGVGLAPARYDHPSMPGYAWPSYAATPNYAAVTYPKQYSPTAWPYIGPFYPYPQVPLGWRKVQLEWDDGWWMLDFRDRRQTLSRGR